MQLSHHYLAFLSPKPGRRAVRELALALMTHYAREQLSPKKWRKRGQIIYHYETKSGKTSSKPFSFDEIESHLDTYSEFRPEDFGLPVPVCLWLDASVDLQSAFHFADAAGVSVKLRLPTNFGGGFPLAPLLDREGHAYSSVLMASLRRMCRFRETLVATSDAYQSDDWLGLLKMAVFESISMIDSTLHQLYYKAAYDPVPTWNYQPGSVEKAQPLKGGRLRDKFRWVYAATHQHPNFTNEMAAFNRIRHLRNHLQHWDPPFFCFTMEDAAGWLNDLLALARMNWAVRVAAGSPPCVPLIRLLLAPEAAFQPAHPAARRIPQAEGIGYSSVIWPTDRADSGYSLSAAQATPVPGSATKKAPP